MFYILCDVFFLFFKCIFLGYYFLTWKLFIVITSWKYVFLNVYIIDNDFMVYSLTLYLVINQETKIANKQITNFS